MELGPPELLGMAVAIGLGLLVGLQREWVADKRIGLRSFALISTIGGVVGLFSLQYGGWMLGAGLLAVTAAVLAHTYFVSLKTQVSGMTTELAAIAMFLIGALATSGHLLIAVVLGGAVTLLLHWKGPMHAWVKRIGGNEFQAIGQFVLITLVVLPVLPNQSYGPFAVLNPWQIWLMVVLIVSINLVGYLAYTLARGRSGTLLSGVVGGLISSTATTVSYSKRSHDAAGFAPMAAIVILVASALVYLRILVETAVVARALLADLLLPTIALLAIFAVAVGVRLARYEPEAHPAMQATNPAELKSALSFGLLYSVVLFVSAAANEFFGETMLYPVAIISGLTDVDAVTLSICRLFTESRINADTAWRVILVASLSNLLFKTGIVALFGGAQLRRLIVPALSIVSLLGFLGVWLWP